MWTPAATASNAKAPAYARRVTRQSTIGETRKAEKLGIMPMEGTDAICGSASSPSLNDDPTSRNSSINDESDQTCAALPILRRRSRERSTTFMVPAGNVVSIISLVLYAWLLSTVDGAKPAIRGAEAF